MKKILLILFFPVIANAGFKELTWHSRANCVNNESITWHAGHSYHLRTVGEHHNLSRSWPCNMDTGEEYTWRSAAVHWGEGVAGSGWLVIGHHSMKDRKGKWVKLGVTRVKDCSIYDGWWD